MDGAAALSAGNFIPEVILTAAIGDKESSALLKSMKPFPSKHIWLGLAGDGRIPQAVRSRESKDPTRGLAVALLPICPYPGKTHRMAATPAGAPSDPVDPGCFSGFLNPSCRCY